MWCVNDYEFSKFLGNRVTSQPEAASAVGSLAAFFLSFPVCKPNDKNGTSKFRPSLSKSQDNSKAQIVDKLQRAQGRGTLAS
jgi:hypothetical protein